MDRELEEILADDYLASLTARSVPEIRAMRNSCQEIETTLSYLRRLAQGRLDIVQVEIGRRREGGDPADLTELIERLPVVLSDRTRGDGHNGPLPQVWLPDRLAGELVEELAGMEVEAHLTNLPMVDDEWLETIRGQLMTYEARVSQLRRQLFERIDALQDELTRRYRSGEASVDALIAGT